MGRMVGSHGFFVFLFFCFLFFVFFVFLFFFEEGSHVFYINAMCLFFGLLEIYVRP
jgi:hypothetical protein